MAPLKASFDDLFAGIPVMAILRGYSVDRTVELATAAWDLGMTAVEIPIQSESALAALRAAAAAGKERGMLVGAGTVIRPEHVWQAEAAGAAFTVSPGLGAEVVQLSLEAGLPALPGVATASDIQRALDLGLTWLKAFPAAELGPSWFKAMQGPFPEVNFVATGGMNVGNARDFLNAGASVVSLGSALSDPSSLPAIARLLKEGSQEP